MDITYKKIKNHFAYNFWIYIAIVVFSIFFWDIIYNATAYRPPKDKVVELYVADNPLFDEKKFNVVKNHLADTILNDMEEINAYRLIGNGTEDVMSNMQINTYIFSSQGDVYIMSKDRFQGYARLGAFLQLDPHIADSTIKKDDYDYKRGFVSYTDNDGEKYSGIYGISLRNTPVLKEYGIDTDNSYIAILYSTANEENSVKMLNYIINMK